MGIIVKIFNVNGVVLTNAYLGINKTRSTGSLTEIKIKVDVYPSVDAKVKGQPPATNLTLSLNLSDEDIAGVPIFKNIYSILKNMFEDVKDCKDFDKSKDPVISGIVLSKDGSQVIVSGTMVSGGQIAISGINPEAKYKLSSEGKNWKLEMAKENYVQDSIFLSVLEEGVYESNYIQVDKKALV